MWLPLRGCSPKCPGELSLQPFQGRKKPTDAQKQSPDGSPSQPAEPTMWTTLRGVPRARPAPLSGLPVSFPCHSVSFLAEK
jgi:hypothetical protein